MTDVSLFVIPSNTWKHLTLLTYAKMNFSKQNYVIT